MATYKPSKFELAYNEIFVVCSQCKAELIKEIEMMATGEPTPICRCPECLTKL